MMDLKQCSRCSEIKPLNEFHKDRRNKDGHTALCKKCINKQNSAYRRQNREKTRKTARLSTAKHRRKNKKIISNIKCKNPSCNRYLTEYQIKNNNKYHKYTCYVEHIRAENKKALENIEELTKVCTNCGEKKSVSEFSKWKDGKYGYYPQCKQCKKEWSRFYRKENPEKNKEVTKEYYYKIGRKKRQELYNKLRNIISDVKCVNPSCNENLTEYQKLRNWKFHSKKCFTEFNTGENNARWKGGWADKKKKIPKKLRKLIMEKAKHTCEWCLKYIGKKGGHVDHLIPESNGGLTEEWNLAYFCRNCNCSKWAHNLIISSQRRNIPPPKTLCKKYKKSLQLHEQRKQKEIPFIDSILINPSNKAININF